MNQRRELSRTDESVFVEVPTGGVQTAAVEHADDERVGTVVVHAF